MRFATLLYIALIGLVLPVTAEACTVMDPFIYPIRGGYLWAAAAAGIAIALELFRLHASSDIIKRKLRIGSAGFAILALMGLIFASSLKSAQTEWRQSLPEQSLTDGDGKRC